MGCHFLLQGNLPDPGIKPSSLTSSALAGGFTTEPPGFPGDSGVKNLPAEQETRVRALGQEDSPGGGHGTPLQYSCLENPMDRGAWWAAVHGVAKSRTQLSDFTFKEELS